MSFFVCGRVPPHPSSVINGGPDHSKVHDLVVFPAFISKLVWVVMELTL